MIILFIFVASFGIALWRGGRLSNLRDLPIRHLWLFFIPVALQLVVFSPLSSTFNLSDDAIRTIYVASMLLVAVALWLNRRLPGIAWIITGFILNLTVISLNGGFMPISNAAREVAGFTPATGRYANTIPITDTTILPWLGDVLPLPGFLGIKGVFSVGDVLIIIGGVIFTQRALKPLPKEQYLH